VLGVFGDPAETGKPAGDDLREGKRTALVAAVLDGGDAQARETVRRLLGRAELSEREVGELTAVIVDTGALDHVEGLIARRLTEALAALDEAPVAQAAADALRKLAVAATARAA
jgi:geranylgeranyl diphosphate synthase, type I